MEICLYLAGQLSPVSSPFPLEFTAVGNPPPARSPWGFTGLQAFCRLPSSEGSSADLEGPGHGVDQERQ